MRNLNPCTHCTLTRVRAGRGSYGVVWLGRWRGLQVGGCGGGCGGEGLELRVVEQPAGGGAGPPNRHRVWVLAGACRDARRREEPSGGWPEQVCPQQVNRLGGTDPCVGRGQPRPQAAAKMSNHLFHSISSVEPTGEVGATMSTPGRADHAQVAVKTWRLPAQQGTASQAFRSAANEAAVAVSSLHPNGGRS